MYRDFPQSTLPDQTKSNVDTHNQFTVPDDPLHNPFYHKVDLHNRQNDVPVHYNRSHLHQEEGGKNKNKTGGEHDHHSEKYYERKRFVKAVRSGDVSHVKAFIQEKHFLKPTADPDTDINRYFVHHHHHHSSKQETPEERKARRMRGITDFHDKDNCCESSDEEEFDLKEETEADNTGLNILIEAVRARKTEVVKELLKIPNIATEQRDRLSGNTALLLAAQNHDLETLKILLDDDKTNPTGKSRVDKAAVCEPGAHLQQIKKLNHFRGFNALMFACHSHGFSSSSVQASTVVNNNNNQTTTINQDTDEQQQQIKHHQEQQMHHMKTQVELVRQILLHTGFDINHESADGRTAIFVACGHCLHPQIVEVLTRAGAKFSAAIVDPTLIKQKTHLKRGAEEYDGGSFPIHESVKYAKFENLKVLLSHLAADKKAKTQEVNVAYGSYKITPLLLAVSGATGNDISIPSSGEESRLHFGSDKEEKSKVYHYDDHRRVFFEIVKLLIENGADPSITGGIRDELPLEVAKRENHLEIAQYLSGIPEATRKRPKKQKKQHDDESSSDEYEHNSHFTHRHQINLDHLAVGPADAHHAVDDVDDDELMKLPQPGDENDNQRRANNNKKNGALSGRFSEYSSSSSSESSHSFNGTPKEQDLVL